MKISLSENLNFNLANIFLYIQAYIFINNIKKLIFFYKNLSNWWFESDLNFTLDSNFTDSKNRIDAVN